MQGENLFPPLLYDYAIAALLTKTKSRELQLLEDAGKVKQSVLSSITRT